jgi:RimJ/RimL family protein N-acetyltransferase
MNDAPELVQLTSTRLIIRPINLNDSVSIFRYRSDAVANKYQGWIPKNLAETDDFIKNRVCPKINVPDTWFQFVMIIKDNNKLIGDLGVHFFPSDDFQAEVGITIDKQFQGLGYATEALETVITYLFLTLNKRRVIASIDPRNDKSINLVKRLGFRKEAHFKESILINGEWLDDLVFAILKSEWNEKLEI